MGKRVAGEIAEQVKLLRDALKMYDWGDAERGRVYLDRAIISLEALAQSEVERGKAYMKWVKEEIQARKESESAEAKSRIAPGKERWL